MQYGHGSLISVVVLAGVFLIRYLGSQRRRGGPPVGSRGPRSQFTNTDPRVPAPPPTAEPPTTGGSGGLPAGWFRDPFVRHDQRFWSGTEWTDHVTDDGVPSTDPPPTPSGSGDPA
jgi:hypothetical protein